MTARSHRWDAFGVPWIAEELAKTERMYQEAIDRSATVSAELKTHHSRPYMKLFADNMTDAELFWMSRTTLAVATDLATRDIPKTTFQELIATSDLPPVGMMLWPKSLATFGWRSVDMMRSGQPAVQITWDGIAWVYDDTHITTFLLSQMREQRKLGLLSDMRPKTAPGKVDRFEKHELTREIDRNSSLVELSIGPIDDPELVGATPPTLTATVVSLFALIGQQRIVTRTRVSTEKSKKSTRTARNDVTLVDIVRPPGVAATGSQSRDEMAFRRWFVRGHYRHQPYGPGNSLRKLIYVALHTAGHPDAPEPTGPPPTQVSAVYGTRFERR